MPKTPTYRKREGRSQALVTLTDSATKRRRDFWLGEHETAESRELYHRVIAEWEANGRRFPTAAPCQAAPEEPAGLMLVALLRDFYRWAKRNYDKGDCYTTDSYRRAIWYACDRAFPPPPPLGRGEAETVESWWKRLKEKKLLGKLNEWRKPIARPRQRGLPS